jgi:hypothetical protein
MTLSYYEVRTQTYLFFATVLNEHGNIKIRFGNKKSCITYGFHEDDEHPYLSGFSFDQKCAENLVNSASGLLPKTSAAMLKASIYFVYHFCTGKSCSTGNIEFKDTSFVDCSKRDDYDELIRMKLYILYLCKYRQTWYQAKFAAKPVDDRLARSLQLYLDYVSDAQNKLPFDAFVNRYIGPGIISRGRFQKVVDKLMSIYVKHATYKDFFRELADTKDCYLFENWIYKFFNEHCDPSYELNLWHIPKDTLDMKNWQVTVKQIPDLDHERKRLRFAIHGGGHNTSNRLHLQDAD